jgi:hypothetical protein
MRSSAVGNQSFWVEYSMKIQGRINAPRPTITAATPEMKPTTAFVYSIEGNVAKHHEQCYASGDNVWVDYDVWWLIRQ